MLATVLYAPLAVGYDVILLWSHLAVGLWKRIENLSGGSSDQNSTAGAEEQSENE